MDREERIDKYVSGQMDEVEKAAFESEMNQNEDFAADVRLRQEIVLAVRRKGVEDVFRGSELKSGRFVPIRHASGCICHRPCWLPVW